MTNPQIALLVFRRGNKFLAVSRKTNLSDFGFPGGKIEPGESPVQGLQRELMEETGLTMVSPRLVATKDNSGYKVHLFTCADLRGTPHTMEAGVVKWLSAQEIAQGPSFGAWNTQVLQMVFPTKSASDKELLRKYREHLKAVQDDLDKQGLAYFAVIEDPNNPGVGASIFNGRGLGAAAHNARQAHMKWERKNRIDTNHDWREELAKSASELLKGGLADGKKAQAFNRVELKKGISTELEHTSSKQKAKEIAMDHLTEHPSYYKELPKMEQKLDQKEKKAGGPMDRMSLYLAYKQAAEEEKKKEEKKKDDTKEDKKEGGEKKESGSSEKKESPPTDPNAPPPGASMGAMPPGMPPQGPVAAPPQMGMGMNPMAGQMPTPMSPVDVMGQGLQQTTQGVNQMIDAFYAMQGGAPSAAPTPSAAPMAPAVPGDPTGQGSVPSAPTDPNAPAAAQPQQKVAGAEVGGRYTCTDSSAGGRYYQFLRSRVDVSNARVNGRA